MTKHPIESQRDGEPVDRQRLGVNRRTMLRWLGVAPGALSLAGCSDGATGPGRDGSADGPEADLGRDGQVALPDFGSAADLSAPGRDGLAGDAGASDGLGTCERTTSDVLGPFHLPGSPFRTEIAGANEPGPRIIINGVVYGPDCTSPLANAVLDIWQADVGGNYHDAQQNYRLRGQLKTNAQGQYAFESIKPGNYDVGGALRPAHIHFIVSMPGHLPLTTQMYFAGDPYLGANDPCFPTCASGDPKRIVSMAPVPGLAATQGNFDIVLAKAS